MLGIVKVIAVSLHAVGAIGKPPTVTPPSPCCLPKPMPLTLTV